MNLSLTTEDIAFRDEVRSFIGVNLKPEWRSVSDLSARTDLQATKSWTTLLANTGWLTSGWPPEFGGRQLTEMQKYILSSETARARAPLVSHMHFGMVAPLITMFGSQWQKEHFLPRILSSEDIWAQGFSEPGAGSDLASLRTTARRDGDLYIVNGQKIWTTYAHEANELFCLVRTNPEAAKPQMGISMLLIPMDLAGITVRPIRTIDGAHHFNEVFLDDVRVPADRLLGEENHGWPYAKALLAHERSGIAEVQPSRAILADVRGVAADAGLLEDAAFTARLATLEIELDALEVMELRFMECSSQGADGGYEASLLKIVGSELRQNILMLGVEALGPLAQIQPGQDAPRTQSGKGAHFAGDALFYRAASIYGGANEIQRNVVAKLLLASNNEI